MNNNTTKPVEEVRIGSVKAQLRGRATMERPLENPDLALPADWPPRPPVFPELMTPLEAAQYLRLDQTGSHIPLSAVRTLNFWRNKGQLRATKYARHVWFRRAELDRFLEVKTET